MLAAASFWWDAEGSLGSALLLLQFACCLFMTGLIWFVQIVHYPLLVRVGPENWPQYHRAHCQRTGTVVLPVMLGEILSAGALLLRSATLRSSGLYWLLCLLLALIWLSTALLQAPVHNRLRPHPEPKLLRRLVWENWLRTVAWTLRSIGLALIIC